VNFFFLFYQSTVLSHQAVDGHQMYLGGSVVGKASTIDSAADCSIALKFGTEFHHITGDTLQMFKVKGQRSRL